MLLNAINGFYYPAKPIKATQSVEFTVTFNIGVIHRWDDDSYRYFYPGISYAITGIKRNGAGDWQMMLTDSRIVTVADPDQFTVRCETIGTRDEVHMHEETHRINVKNAAAKRKAIKYGASGYPFYVDVATGSEPLLHVPIRPQRNQVNKGQSAM